MNTAKVFGVNIGKEQKMLNQMFEIGGLVKSLIAKIPYFEIVKSVKTSTFTYFLFGAISLFTALILFGCVKAIVKRLKYHSVKKFFGIVDLSGFKLKRMGGASTKYYSENGVNEFSLGIPHLKGKSKVIKENSILWLIAGRRTHVLLTKDPFAMLHLVHELRDSGLDISPCDQELEKQKRIRESQKSADELISDIINSMKDESDFVELCRQRLTIHGFTVSDAPRNNDGVQLFINHHDQPKMVKCLFSDRSELISTEAIESFKDSLQKFFVNAGILITTGKVSVAAVSLAKAHDIEIIFNDGLVDLLKASKEISAAKQYLRWELTSEDLNEMLPKEVIEKFF